MRESQICQNSIEHFNFKYMNKTKIKGTCLFYYRLKNCKTAKTTDVNVKCREQILDHNDHKVLNRLGKRFSNNIVHILETYHNYSD